MSMNGQVALGIAASACIVIFWLVKGQKTPATFGLVVVGVVVIMVAVTHWNAVVQPFLGGASPSPTVSVPAPASAHPVHVVHGGSAHQSETHPTITAHLVTPTPATPATQATGNPASLAQPAQGMVQAAEELCGIGFFAVIGLLVLSLTLVAQRQKAYWASTVTRQPGCSECGQQDGMVKEYRWQDGVAQCNGRLCGDCAGRFSATPVS